MKTIVKDGYSAFRSLGIPLIGEGVAMAICCIPALYFRDGTSCAILLSSLFTVLVGGSLLWLIPQHKSSHNTRVSYVTVTLMWFVLVLFGTLPFLTTGVCSAFSDAFFESMSGLSSTGATIFPNVEILPRSILLWRSLSEWMGGFGIILLVLAIVPSLGINKYSLYTAETSGADNTGKTTIRTRTMVQRTLSIYVILTIAVIVALFASGMSLWESVNLAFTNISTGGFSVYADGISRFSAHQHLILAVSMFLGGVNFVLLFNLLTFRWKQLKHKMDQFGLYLSFTLLAVLFTVVGLHCRSGYTWKEALHFGSVQAISALTTTGSMVADTTLWWTPIVFLFLILCTCGGMAGSTTGGIKIMRVLILFRNVSNILSNRLHPHAVNPVRLNGKPVSPDIITNVMVITLVYTMTMIVGFVLLRLCGINTTESIGAVFGCLTSFGPGLGTCGGFGSYASFCDLAKYICSMLMLLGRLECITVFILFIPGFWSHR